MKLRLRGNSVRLRLSENEVSRLGGGAALEEHVRFPDGVLCYRLGVGGDEVVARYCPGAGIDVTLPAAMAREWALGAEVALAAEIAVPGSVLNVLVEKDLKPDRD